MFEDLGDQHGRLKSMLVSVFGKMVANSTTLALAIPQLYRAMTDQSPLVRAGAANACAALSAYASEDFPDLLYETFLLLLSDPYVIVHQAAVESLRAFRVPSSLVPRVSERLTILILAYKNSRSDDRVLSLCIGRLLALSREDSELSPSVRNAVVRIINEVNTDAALEVVRHQGRRLRGSPGYAALIVKLLSEAELTEYNIADLVEELSASPPSEVRTIAEKLRAVAKNCSAHGHDITNELLEILTTAGVWRIAADIAIDATDKFADTVWDRGRKLRSLARQLSAQIEAAAADRDMDAIFNLTVRWRETLEQIKQDNENNEKKRNPFFGVPIQDPGE
jgi:hypothetical protein